MRNAICFVIAVITLAGCANSLKRKHTLFDGPPSEIFGHLKFPAATPRSCMVKEYNFLDTCRTKFTSALYLDTARIPFEQRLSKIGAGDDRLDHTVRAKTRQFYEKAGFKTEWLELDAPLEQFFAFAEEVEKSGAYGIDPYAYGVNNLEREIQRLYLNPQRTGSMVSQLDVRITSAFFHFTTDLIEGRFPPGSDEQFIWKLDQRTHNDVELLLNIKSRKQLSKEIANLHPSHPQYQKLREEYIRYSALAHEHGSLPAISVQGWIEPGDDHEAMPAIRARLALCDLLPDLEDSASLRYDERLAIAVRAFQRRHGLLDDGIIGKETLSHLNMSFREKADLIALNLERLRWLPGAFPDRYISINIPEYKLRVYEQGKPVVDMKVVLGSVYTATPVFSDTLEHIVFSPTWNVPYSIIGNEMIPRLKKDSSYYTGKHYTFYKHGQEIDPALENWKDERLNIFDYNVVQAPGTFNALGLVKFIMPNNMFIYLHDTPAASLFEKQRRALSHGCIRLEDPAKLAQYLLSDRKDWDRERIAQAMWSGTPETVHLSKSFHVQITYLTAWVDDTGQVNFREDVYGYDARQLPHLNKLLVRR